MESLMRRPTRKSLRALNIALCLSFFCLAGLLFAQAALAESPHAAAYAPPAQGADLCVATPNDGATEFSAFDASPIQQAIDALEPLSDTVRVGGACVGVFFRNGMTQTVYISRSLHLIGGYIPAAPVVPLSADTIIDAGCGGRGVVINGPIAVTLENLNITCGDATGLNGPIADDMGNGGGLLINGANVNLVDTQIYGNFADKGGGVFIGSTLTVGAGSAIHNNVAAIDGGGVFVNSNAATSALVLDGGEISHNSADRDGGGAYIDDPAARYTQNSGVIGYNEAGRDGGGLYVYAGQATLLGGQVISNTVQYFEGGGIYLATITGSLFISNTQILYNQALGNDGGGITTNGGLTMISSEVAYNYAYDDGGGIDNDVEGLTLIVDSFIHDNVGVINGGGIDSDAPLEVRNTRFLNNATTYNNPPTFISDGGAGIHSSAPLTVIGSHFENNSTAGRGGGLYLTGGLTTTTLISSTQILGNLAVGDGGGVRSFSNLTVVNSTIADNISQEDGGGIDDDYGRLLVRNSLLQNNTTAEDGGGIEVNGVLTVEGSTIVSNTAGFTGGGIWVEKTTAIKNSTIISNAAGLAGGGFTNARGVATIDNSIIAQNKTPHAGGGLLNSEGGQLTMRNSQVRDNRAVDGGGVANLDGALLIESSEISSNQANNGGAVFNSSAASILSIINSTISANTGLNKAGGIRNSGYAGIGRFYIFGQGGVINLLHVTLSDNSAASLLDSSIGNDSGVVNVKNSVLNATAGLNCFNAGALNSQGGNVNSDGSCGIGNPADLANTDPHLGPLANNGGPLLPDGSATRTHALLLTSPARDFVHCELVTDQRGAPRPSPFTSLCDSGAYELQNVHVDVGVQKTVTPTTAQPGQPVTYTITVRNLGDIANRVVITDAIPAEIVVSSVISSGVNFVQTSTAPYRWHVDQLDQAAVGSIVVAGIVNPDVNAAATVLNTATVAASGDFTPTNNSSVASLIIAPPHIHFDHNAYSVQESAGVVTLTVLLDAANPHHAVTINYAITNGTATAGNDYTNNSGSLTIPAGALSATITIPITNDAVVERDETFTVALSQPRGAVLDAPTTATVTIVNDDAATLSINDVAQLEGDSGFTNFAFTVTLDKAVDTGFTLTAATSNGTASSGHDYTATNVLLGFAGAAGETQTVLVPVHGDLIGELDETFNVTLSNLASSGRNVTLADAIGVGTIQNDDGPGVIVQPTTLAVSEPDTTAVFVLTLTSQPTADVVVSLTATDASECSVPASATLNVNNWQTGVTVTVTAVDDDIVDGDQLCAIELTAVSSDPIYNDILIENVDVIVADDDTPPPNEPPVVADQSFSIDENSPLGTVVGMVAASDPDLGQTLTYNITAITPQPFAALVADASADSALAASSFVIGATTGQLMLTGQSPNYEEIPQYRLTVEVADSGAPALRQTATVTVVIRNVNEPPVVVHPLPSQQVLVNDAAGFAMTSNTFADPDLNDVLSYSATLVDGSPLPAWLAFDPTTGLFGGTPATAQTLTIRITATDLGGLQASTDFVLTVTGIPTSLEESDEPAFKAQIFLPIMERR